jgi:type IV pilus assembly protein PilQ
MDIDCFLNTYTHFPYYLVRRYSMSKLNGADKRKFYSFIICFCISAWFIFGCAAKTSVEMNRTDNTQSAVKSADIVQSPDKSVTETEAKVTEQNTDETAIAKEVSENKDYSESEPRIFIQPTESKFNLILGIDFSMLPQGKSKLTVTTSKEVKYDLERVDDNRLSLIIHDSKIGELLLKDINTTEFQTALEKIRPVYDKKNHKVALDIVMREVVPFHINQTEKNITIDFGTIKNRISERKIVPLNMAGTETRNLADVSGSSEKQSQTEIQAFSPSVNKKYKGQPLGLVFDNADVTHILKLINEVSEENIIWDPAIKGKKVSMILNNVPWDEALELVLKNNELAKRYVGQNIVWITTKQKMAQILAEEESETKKMDEKLEQERLKLEEQKKRSQEEAPLITEYLPVDFATAKEIEGHLIKSKRGSISVDTRTNTIIMTDTAESIEEAKKIVKQFDSPVKQIMIEARIVDATENFSRDLGIRWNSETSAFHSKNGSVTSTADIVDQGSNGEQTVGGSFSTNAPSTTWGQNGLVGFNFGRISGNGLGNMTLDASLAIAESNGTAKTLSAPKVIAQEGSEATISSGEIVKIAATENVKSEDFPAELSLSVTPSSVSFNNYITLNINVSDDQRVTDTRKTTKTINTTLMVKSGETVVIGGIIKESTGMDVTGVPILKDIPGLGWLFKAKTNRKTKSELLIFLTPVVMPSPVKQF